MKNWLSHLRVLSINIAILTGALLAIACVGFEGLLITVFSTTREFWYSAEAASASIAMLALGLVLRNKARRSFTIGASLFFGICSAAILLTHFGLLEDPDYTTLMDIALPSWHYDVFFYGSLFLPAIPAIMLIRKWPSRETEQPTTGVNHSPDSN